jgi:hypothetical protein
VILLALAALLLLPGLGRMRATENTDARYLEISRAMHASGDWLLPKFAGRPHLDKPPLTYWAASLGYATLGVTPFAGKLLEQLALAGTALLIGLAGRRWLGRDASLAAALVFLSSGLVFATSRVLATDLFQLVFFTAAMLAFLRGVTGPARPGSVWLAFALLGASMNAKGPIALFVAAAIWLPFLALTRGQTRVSPRAVAVGLAAFVVLGAPWYLALEAREPGILSYFLRVQLLARVTGEAPDIRHLHGPFYLLGSWPLALLPWTPLVALALWRLRPREGWRRADPLDLYLLLWATVPVLFFSIPRSKIATYLLPALPAAALAIGRALETGRLGDRAARIALLGCASLASAAALALAAALLWPGALASSRFETELLVARPAFAAALVAVAMLAFAAVWRLAPASLRAIRATALATGATFALGFTALAPGFASWRDEGLLARSVPGAWLLAYGVDRASALYYFGDVEHYLFARALTEEERGEPRDEDAVAASPEEGLALLRGEQPVFCLTKAKLAPQLTVASGAAVVRERLGTVLLANPAAQQALAAQAAGSSPR